MQNKKPRPGLLGLGIVMLLGVALLLTGCAGDLDPTDYQVQQDETLTKIAADHNTTVADLAQLNGLAPDGEAKPPEGTVLKIPAPPIPAYPGPNSPDQLYEVQPGDTLVTIAAQYKNLEMTVEKLMAANNLTNRNHIRVGQLLLIPGPKIPPPPVCSHYFHQGEALIKIAAYYGVNQSQVLDENGLPTTGAMIAGDKLNITMPINESQRKFKQSGDCPDPALYLKDVLQGGPGQTQVQKAVPALPAPPPSDWNGPTEEYLVKPGDTLYSIAVRYHTSVAILAKDNNIANPRLIHPGQKLLLRKNI